MVNSRPACIPVVYQRRKRNASQYEQHLSPGPDEHQYVQAAGCVLLSREGGRWRDDIGQRGEGGGVAWRGAAWEGGEGGRRISPARRLPIRRAIRRRPASAADRVPGPGPCRPGLVNPESSSAPTTRARLGSSPDGGTHKILWDLDGSRCPQERPLRRGVW